MHALYMGSRDIQADGQAGAMPNATLRDLLLLVVFHTQHASAAKDISLSCLKGRRFFFGSAI